MTIETGKFVRKPFYIDAVQVTEENMDSVAAWCQGEVKTVKDAKGKVTDLYVKVRVHRPLNERQTKAYVGDHVLYAGSGYKVYTAKAFSSSFEPVEGKAKEAMDKNVAEKEAEAKAIRDEKFAQIELTEKIEELMTIKEPIVLFKEPSK